jgi:hypothetical protein
MVCLPASWSSNCLTVSDYICANLGASENIVLYRPNPTATSYRDCSPHWSMRRARGGKLLFRCSAMGQTAALHGCWCCVMRTCAPTLYAGDAHHPLQAHRSMRYLVATPHASDHNEISFEAVSPAMPTASQTASSRGAEAQPELPTPEVSDGSLGLFTRCVSLFVQDNMPCAQRQHEAQKSSEHVLTCHRCNSQRLKWLKSALLGQPVSETTQAAGRCLMSMRTTISCCSTHCLNTAALLVGRASVCSCACFVTRTMGVEWHLSSLVLNA